MGMLQRVGRMGEMGAGAIRGGVGIVARPDPTTARSPERARLAQWKRYAATGTGRADISERRAPGGLAKSDNLVREREAGAVVGSKWSEDDGPIRLGTAVVL